MIDGDSVNGLSCIFYTFIHCLGNWGLKYLEIVMKIKKLWLNENLRKSAGVTSRYFFFCVTEITLQECCEYIAKIREENAYILSSISETAVEFRSIMSIFNILYVI